MAWEYFCVILACSVSLKHQVVDYAYRIALFLQVSFEASH